ncbi:MAG: transcription antitermination factor NusB [SAR324 cluster bacterium]|nr:transcription antitermination factor NusB [SAR324 cluster bacterium]
MSYSRHKCREHALQSLYQQEIVSLSKTEDIDLFLEQLEAPEDANIFTRNLILGTLSNQNAIDKLLEENMEKWRLERLSILVRNLLRLSVYEMVFSKETPYEVVIDEAVTLAKDFVDDIARSFVNKVLQKIYDQSLLP